MRSHTQREGAKAAAKAPNKAPSNYAGESHLVLQLKHNVGGVSPVDKYPCSGAPPEHQQECALEVMLEPDNDSRRVALTRGESFLAVLRVKSTLSRTGGRSIVSTGHRKLNVAVAGERTRANESNVWEEWAADHPDCAL